MVTFVVLVIVNITLILFPSVIVSVMTTHRHAKETTIVPSQIAPIVDKITTTIIQRDEISHFAIDDMRLSHHCCQYSQTCYQEQTMVQFPHLSTSLLLDHNAFMESCAQFQY